MSICLLIGTSLALCLEVGWSQQARYLAEGPFLVTPRIARSSSESSASAFLRPATAAFLPIVFVFVFFFFDEVYRRNGDFIDEYWRWIKDELMSMMSMNLLLVELVTGKKK